MIFLTALNLFAAFILLFATILAFLERQTLAGICLLALLALVLSPIVSGSLG